MRPVSESPVIELDDKLLAQLMTELANASRKASELQKMRSAYLILRSFLLHKTRQIFYNKKTAFIEKKYQAELDKVKDDTAIELAELKVKIQEALQRGDFIAVENVSRRANTSTENLALEEARIEKQKQEEILQIQKGKLTDEEKRQKLEVLTQRNGKVSELILAAERSVLSQADETNSIANRIVSHTAASIYQRNLTYCQQVERKAKSVSGLAKPEEFKELMRAASHFEPDKVKAMLDENRHLIYAQGDFDQAFEKTKDGKEKIYKNVTLFQYLWINGDIKLLEEVKGYFNSPQLKEAAIQVLALDERTDIELFSYDDTIKEYNNYINNYSNQDYITQCHHWKKGVGGAQLTWPGYLVAQFTEIKPDNKTSWTEKNISMNCVGISDRESFSSWGHRVIAGQAWIRCGGRRPAAVDCALLAMCFAQADLRSCELRSKQQKADRSRLSFNFKNQFLQEPEGIASDFNWQQSTR